jgi:excisionase family DNA binding protein
MTAARPARAVAEDDAYLDLAALSRVVGLSRRTLRDWIHAAADPMPAYKVGGKLLVRRSEFDRWMSRRRYKAETIDGLVDEVLRELVRSPA